MTPRDFLGDLPPRSFLERHWGRLPLERRGGARAALGLVDEARLDRALDSAGADAFLARDGAMWEGGRAPGATKARELRAEGWTTALRGAHKHDAGLAALAAEFERAFGARADVHLYATPAGRTGFGWHYDVEDVFILQVKGAKEYPLRKNTVYPWPVPEGMGRDLRYEREVSPVLPVRLEEGDALYIPPGWWHRAAAGPEATLTIALGIMTPSALSALELLRAELAANPAWRQRLPVSGGISGRSREELEAEMEALFRELGRDLARALSDGAVARRWLAARMGP